MSFKWQIPIGRQINIPCHRQLYQIGLRSIVLSNLANYKPDELLHVCIQPRAKNSTFWIEDKFAANSVKLVMTPKDMPLQIIYDRDQIDFYEIDLAQYVNQIFIYLINNAGQELRGEGFCIFDLIPVEP